MTSREWTIAVYVVLGLTLVALEVLARLRLARVPTVADLLGAVLRHRSAQLGLVLAWWWLGWHFFCD